MAPVISQYLDLVNLQIASEAFLTHDNGALKTDSDFIDALTEGNFHSSRFTSVDAAAFAEKFEVLAHQKNTSTGFSATLYKARRSDPQSGLQAGQYFISVRSTEFVDDYICDAEGTNRGIKSYGWAFGQISDMEDWYQGLIADNLLPADAIANGQLTLTGYSLGGHVATAFSILRQEAGEPAFSIYTVNGARTRPAWILARSSGASVHPSRVH